MAAKRHTHKYHKIQVADKDVWACALGDCSHYMPNHMLQMMPGKKSICWQCGMDFELDPVNMKEDRPRCDDCNPRSITKTESFVEMMRRQKLAEKHE